jgi:predicted DNA-binding ribbon-helix-helix protein
MYRRHADESDSHGNGLDEFEGTLMRSSILKRSVVIGGHKTSVSLEEPFWTDLKQIARTHHVMLSTLITQIDGTRNEQSNLSSEIRVFVLRHPVRPSGPVAQWPVHGLAANATSFSAARSS